MSLTEPVPKNPWETGKDSQLVLAAGKGDYATVKRLLEDGAATSACCPPPLGKFNNGRAEVLEINGGRLDVRGLYSDRSERFSWEQIARTALQVAAEGGHQDLVQLLIDAGAEVNALPAKYYGRTALQAAAEGGHQDLVQLLIDAGAEVNALPAKYYGRTALQAAAEGGHQDLVQLLIDAGAEVNASPAGSYGRTALQAAAEGGHQDLVQLLIDAGAEVNAPPAEWHGRTALQAAVEGGHQDSVQLLIDAGAEVNAPPSSNGRTALKLAVVSFDRGVLKLLINTGVDLHKKNHLGQTILHKACQKENINRLYFLLEFSAFNLNEKDYLGSTILHIAARKGNKNLVSKILMCEGVDINSKDNSGKTPLQVALEGGFGEILDSLLDRGASTDGLSVDEFLKLRGVESNQDTVILHGALTKRRSMKTTNREDTLVRTLSNLGLSIYLFSPIENHDNTKSFANPRTYLDKLKYPDHIQRRKEVEWSWSILDKDGKLHSGPSMGIPSNQQILSLKPAKVILVGYVCFETCLHEPKVQAAQDEPCTTMDLFKYTTRKVDISWIMRESYGAREKESGQAPDEPGWHFLRSIVYRGTLKLKYISIPSHAVEFFILFLDNIRESWLELVKNAKSHLADMREAQLTSGGEDSKIIQCLLKDSQQWTKLHTGLELHISKSKDLLNTFKTHDALYTELMGSNDGDGDNDGDITEPRVMKGVKEVVENLWAIKKGGRDIGEHERSKKSGGNSEEYETLKVDEGDVGEGGEAKRGGEDIVKKSAIKNDGEDTRKYGETKNLGGIIKKPKTKKDEGGIEELQAIKELSSKIESFKLECESAIKQLQDETKEMIQLEFNLVSIYEARRSIKMSELSLKMSEASLKISETSLKMSQASNSMGMSMKRLSWITFIFLPLMFASGLFGMNVDILETNPSWLWYIAFVVPFLTLVLFSWILFKYVPIADWVENNIGSRVESLLKKPDSNQTSPTLKESGAISPAELGPTDPATTEPKSTNRLDSGKTSFTTLNNLLQRRPRNRRSDEESMIVQPKSAEPATDN